MFKLRIETGNAAFVGPDGEDEKQFEVARILKEVTQDVERGEREGTIHDLNGGRVGEWKLTNW